MKRFICFLIPILMITVNSLVAQSFKNLPMPTGPYQIGITKYDLIDSSRKEIEHPYGRLIPIQIYFPMESGPHNLHPKIFEKRILGKYPPLEVEVYSQRADLSLLNTEKTHPVILLNHGDAVAMTDYAFIAEDLASHGYIVISIQHQLNTDTDEPAFWKERSISKYGKVIDNILYVFEWLKEHQTTLFKERVDLKKIGLIGHSMGGNSLLLFANRTSNVFKKKQNEILLPHVDTIGVKEAIIALDTGGFPYPFHNKYPLFLLLSEEREEYQKKSGSYDDMIKIGHKVKYYKGSKHISFMDHGYVNPQHPLNPNESYFNGSIAERKMFFDEMRHDILGFLKENDIETD